MMSPVTTASPSARKRIDQNELDAICARHDRLWQAKPGGARAVFAWMDLSGLSLAGRNLADADFAAADAKLGFRVVEAKSRQDTQAQGACLAGANLERSKLTGIVAVAADFTDAIMKDCKMVRANLKQASFRGADLAGADLSGADLSGADMRDAVLVGCKMAMWRTDGARMEGCLTDDRPAGAPVGKMPAAEMLAEHAQWCETGGVQGRPSVFDGVDLCALRSIHGYNLTALSAKGAVFYGLDMEGVQLQGAHLEEADLRSVNLKGADLRGARLGRARLNGSDLRGAKLGPLLISADRLLPADLTGACLRGTDLSGADLNRAVLAGADLSRALLHGAIMTQADLTNAVVHGVRGLEPAPKLQP